jgi:hypothetical protein
MNRTKQSRDECQTRRLDVAVFRKQAETCMKSMHTERREEKRREIKTKIKQRKGSAGKRAWWATGSFPMGQLPPS